MGVFHVGKEGKFVLLDAFGKPERTVKGKLIFLRPSYRRTYGLIDTGAEFVSGRLE